MSDECPLEPPDPSSTSHFLPSPIQAFFNAHCNGPQKCPKMKEARDLLIGYFQKWCFPTPTSSSFLNSKGSMVRARRGNLSKHSSQQVDHILHTSSDMLSVVRGFLSEGLLGQNNFHENTDINYLFHPFSLVRGVFQWLHNMWDGFSWYTETNMRIQIYPVKN